MNPIIREASARWKGGAKGGTCAMTMESNALKPAKFSWGMSQKRKSQVDPVQLIAAAHAGSFSRALSGELGLKASAPGEIVTTATLTMENLSAGWTILNIHLHVVAKLPKMTQGRFIDATVRAKMRCLVSRLLRANISMNAKLEK